MLIKGRKSGIGSTEAPYVRRQLLNFPLYELLVLGFKFISALGEETDDRERKKRERQLIEV